MVTPVETSSTWAGSLLGMGMNLQQHKNHVALLMSKHVVLPMGAQQSTTVLPVAC